MDFQELQKLNVLLDREVELREVNIPVQCNAPVSISTIF